MQAYCLKCKKEIKKKNKNKKEDIAYCFSCRSYAGNVNTSKVKIDK